MIHLGIYTYTFAAQKVAHLGLYLACVKGYTNLKHSLTFPTS